MRDKKIVIAYDVVNTRARTKVARILGQYGERVNFSVYECFFSKEIFEVVRGQIKQLINNRSDTVIYYTLCLSCRAAVRVDGRPVRKNSEKAVVSV